MTTLQTDLQLDFGQHKDLARRYFREHPDVSLAELLRLYPARTPQPLPQAWLEQPLQHFLLIPTALAADIGSDALSNAPPDHHPTGELRALLDQTFQEDLARDRDLTNYPERLSDNEAVLIAYRYELEEVARFLKNDLSVLITCDKLLTEHIYEYVCQRAGKNPLLDDAVSEPPGSREAFERAMQGGGGIETRLPLLIRSLKPGQILVLRSVDLLDSPPLIEVLYQSGRGDRKPQLLGFLDPSLTVKKVLTDRFAVHYPIMGLSRYIQPDPQQPPVYTVSRLLTAAERRCFAEFDPEDLYKNVAGLNAIQFRNAMRYVGATVSAHSEARKIFEVIRRFKTSSNDEIEIPDTGFEDIGGYERVKQELQRIIALVAGRVQGIDERERERLIPRGLIFHGPPGTGKTLFAKAIANEMNATIQMISGPEIMDKYVGQSESNLRHIFATARRNAPSVIFFDEFDSIASQRSTYADGGACVNNAVVAQLLTELDGFRRDQTVLLIGTTNRLDIIDEALLRPSRLRPIEIGLPDYTARRNVARIHADNFGVTKLLGNLLELALAHLDAWQQSRDIPPAFLEALFAHHPPYRSRYAAEAQRAAFLRELHDFFQLVQQVQAGENSDAANPLLLPLQQRLREMAATYGGDLDAATPQAVSSGMPAMATDIRELFELSSSTARRTGRCPQPACWLRSWT
jgi:transitional endoplasmic reticulum ATPase